MKREVFKNIKELIIEAPDVDTLNELFHCGYLFLNLTERQAEEIVFTLLSKGFVRYDRDNSLVEYGIEPSRNMYKFPLEPLIKRYGEDKINELIGKAGA